MSKHGDAGPHLTFLGAAETVTGSRYLVEGAEARVLVDCGLFQGLKKLREQNWAKPPFDPASLDAVVLTHAHVDHSGYLPKLCQLGYAGPIYCTPATQDLLRILLPDAAYLQEEEARYANELGYSKHSPALPLYTRADAERALAQVVPVALHQRVDVAVGVTARWSRAGHILGAACVALEVDGRRVTFSGDVGRPSDPIMRPAEPLAPTDQLVIESTYGDRLHGTEPVLDALAQVVNEVVSQGGVLLVPSFAVGRAQHLLHLIAELSAAKRIPRVPVVLDSPMAIDVTGLYQAHRDEHRLSDAQCEAMCRIARYVQGAGESKELASARGPMILISASGMATGGRVLHHLKNYLPNGKNRVLFVGYQAPGTRGHSLVNGASDLKLMGQYVRVRAKVSVLEGISAHADYAELIAWLRESAIAPRRVYVTHGEPAAADAFRRRLSDTFHWRTHVPSLGERVRLV